MFYSQFILARKGPLGTIWIAAHLERKLRKNQVADTDIGESVDSILFPDVPIALRLSSHLLLGVVRIYSRKVNYLFNDCSETLLRVKQAFRSTAVDLPPEESTAPYHSITLPETFDLDDFELPDSALLNGNFVDHHISTREQITLQDTADATTGYSISQFGLDERFGDGDASQIGLDLDEDVVLDKGSSVPDNLLGSEVMEHDMSLQHEENFQSMDIDGCQNDYEEEQHAEITEKLGEDSSVLLEKEQTESQLSCPSQQNLPDTSENAQTPSTPALVQEAIPANFQNMALSPSGKASSSNEVEPIVMNPLRSQMESECHDSNENNDLIKGKQESSHLDADTLKYPSPSLRPCSSEMPIEDTVLGASESLDREEQTRDINKSSRIEINCSASSEYPEPERILLAPGGDEGTTKDLEQSAVAEKCITESDGSVDRGVSTRGRKRQLTESSPQLTGSLTKKSRARRNSDYIPDDDDVLASILVGRSSLKLKSTPSLPAAIPSKRQRLTPKTTVAKRKVLLDETMVLHPDTIREQLVSTEDIRRTRRKAPCTRAEIWVIQKCLMEEEVFCEPVFTGMPAELAVLYSQAFDLKDAPDQEFNADYSILGLHVIQSSDLYEKSTVNEIESNREILAFDEAGKEEIPDAVETSQLVVHETPSSDKGECEVHVNQIFEEGQRFDGDTNTDTGANTLDDVPGALDESTLDQNVERDREDEGDVIPISEILPVKAQEAEVEENPSTVGENSVFHDIMNLERSQIFDSAAPRDSNDFCSAVGGDDSGFLVVDDADFDEEENEEPDTEEAQSTENSGWSSRTKGVARFLRSIFGDENGGEKTDVAVDQLLAGKTRKEASRMFFETLVLSTKDFILVEQESSFKNISIRPRSKLLKSEF